MEINRIYVTYLVSKEIFESQILNWSEYLEEYGIKSKHIMFLYRNQQKDYNRNFNSLKNKITSKVISKIYLFKDFQFFFFLFNFIFSMKNRKSIVLITRDASFSHIYIILKFLLRIKVIYEIRAAGEFLDKSLTMSLRKFLIKLKEKVFVRYCDAIFCVSNYLKNFKANELKIKNKDRIKVFWGVADDKTFFYNKELRQQTREKIGIKDNEILIIYTGSLNNHWNEANLLFTFLPNLLENISNLKILILTQDIESIKKKYPNFLEKQDRIFLTYCEQDELNSYLNAADVGLLLRREHLLNNVSSPTKFSEYILTGLPVIISKSVSDYSEFTSKYDCGLVINNIFNLIYQNSEDYINLVKFLNELQKYDRYSISNLGKNYLSKRNFINEMKDVYYSLYYDIK